jgi:hypothetical protein
MKLDKLLREAYEPGVRASMSDRDGSLMARLAAESQARWDALTPEQQELETLRRQVGHLTEQLAHIQRVLNGEECNDW